MPWAPDYITLAQLKSHLRISDTVDDAELPVAITAASRAIDEHCNRQFGQVDAAEERRYSARWDYERRRWVVDIDDLQDPTDIGIQVAAGSVDVFTLEPVNAVLKGLAWTRLVVDPTSTALPTGEPNEVAIMALWGWTAVPVPVVQAARLQASRFFARRNSPLGVAGSPEAGSELRLLSRVDPDVGVALRGGYRRARKVA